MLKTILAAALILGATSAFASEFDANLENRYPQATSHALVTKPVALQKQAPSSALDIAGQTFGGGY
jgi:hypothetical protein